MLNLFKKKKADQKANCLILDIGTEFIKTLVCEVDFKTNNISIIGSGKQRNTLGDTQAGNILDIASCINNCNLAIEEAENQAGVSPVQMLMGISGELIKGKSTTVNTTREHPEKPINLNELKNIVHQVQWQAFDQIKKELSLETGHQEIEIKLVNAVVSKVEIDGMPALNPLGFQGKKMKLEVFNSFAPLMQFGALQTVAAELDRDLVSIITQPYALSRAMTETESADLSAVFIDIGGAY